MAKTSYLIFLIAIIPFFTFGEHEPNYSANNTAETYANSSSPSYTCRFVCKTADPAIIPYECTGMGNEPLEALKNSCADCDPQKHSACNHIFSDDRILFKHCIDAEGKVVMSKLKEELRNLLPKKCR